jgi:hypothetical protein
MAMYIDFATAPYAAQANQMAMLFFYSGLVFQAVLKSIEKC